MTDFGFAARSVNILQKVKVERAVVAMRYEKEIAEIYSSDAEGDEH